MKSVLKIIFLLGVVLKFSLAIECDKVPKNDELRLKRDILCSYDKSVRPYGGSKNATIIKVKMVLKSYDYTEYNNHINVLIWMVMAWKDDHFKWDPREYGNLKSFYEMSDQIWMPDLSLYNGELQETSCERTNCLISSDGNVVCVPPCKYNGHCAGSFSRWPYDRQNCTLTFGAWIHTGEEINFVGAKTKVESSDSLVNHEWKLLSISMTKHSGNYACCPNQTFPSLRYNFIIERHSAVYTVYLLIPTTVLVLINILTLMVPPTGNERWILISLSFVGHLVFIQQLSWTVPKNGVIIPSCLLFFRDSTAIIGILALDTIIVRLLMSLDCEVPGWLSSPVDAVKDSAAGKFLVEDSKIKMEKIEEGADDDTTILVEPKVNGQIKLTKWKFVAKLIDRLVLISVTLTYFFLIILLIPESYESSEGLPTFDIGFKNVQQ